MEKIFNIKDGTSPNTLDTTDATDKTYDSSNVYGSPREPAENVEVITKNDSYHFSVKNRPIIQILDNSLSTELKALSFLAPFNGIIKINNGFNEISFSNKEIVFLRGMCVVFGTYIDFVHQIYEGKEIILTDNLTINFPTVVADGQYYIQIDSNGDFWADPTPDVPHGMIIGEATFLNEQWTAYTDLRSYIWQGNSNDTNEIKNKFISNEETNQSIYHTDRLTVLENGENSNLRDDISQIARDLYEEQLESGYEFGNGIEAGWFLSNLAIRLGALKSTLDSNGTTISLVLSELTVYKKNLIRSSSLMGQDNLTDLNQQIELDYLKNNLLPQYQLITETFLKSTENDLSDTNSNIPAEIFKINLSSDTDLMVNKYRDLVNKTEIKPGFLRSSEKIKYGSIINYVDFDIGAGDISYDSDLGCWWGIYHGDKTTTNGGNFFKLSIDESTLKITILKTWHIEFTTAYSSLSGICVDADYVYLSNNWSNSEGGEIYILPKVSTAGVLLDSISQFTDLELQTPTDGRFYSSCTFGISGLAIGGDSKIYFIKRETVSTGLGNKRFFRLSKFEISGDEIVFLTEAADLTNLLMINSTSAALFKFRMALGYDAENEKFYFSDYLESITYPLGAYSSVYCMNETTLEVEKVIGTTSRFIFGVGILNGFLFVTEASSETSMTVLNKRQIKNTYIEDGQISKWEGFDFDISGLDTSFDTMTAEDGIWDNDEECYWILFGKKSTPWTSIYVLKYDGNKEYLDSFKITVNAADIYPDTASPYLIIGCNSTSVFIMPSRVANIYEISKSSGGDLALTLPVQRTHYISSGTFECNASTGFCATDSNFYIFGWDNPTYYYQFIYRVAIPGVSHTDITSGHKLFYCGKYSSLYQTHYRSHFEYGFGMSVVKDENGADKELYILGDSSPTRSDISSPNLDAGDFILVYDLKKSYDAIPTVGDNGFKYGFYKRKFNIHHSYWANWAASRQGQWGKSLFIKDNGIYLWSGMKGSMAKVADTDHLEYEPAPQYFSATTAPIAIVNDASGTYSDQDNVGYTENVIAIGERYYSPDEYVNQGTIPTYVLPKRFLIVGNIGTIYILDITDPNNPIKFIQFKKSGEAGSSINALYSQSTSTTYRFKMYQDVLYYGGSNFHEIGVIDFKNNKVYLISGQEVKQYASDNPLKTRNAGDGWETVKYLDNSTLTTAGEMKGIDVKEIDGKIYGLFTIDGVGIEIFNFSDWEVYTTTTGGANVITSKMTEEGRIFNARSTGYGILEFDFPINQIKTNNGWPHKEWNFATLSDGGASGDIIDLEIVPEYDLSGTIINNKIYYGFGDSDLLNVYGLGVLDEGSGKITLIYNGSNSKTSYQGVGINDDVVGFSGVRAEPSYESGSIVLSRLKDDKKITKEINYRLSNGGRYMGSNGIFSQLSHNFFCVSTKTFTQKIMGEALFVPYRKYNLESEYNKDGIVMRGDERRVFSFFTENLKDGYRTKFIDQSDAGIVFDANWQINQPSSTGLFNKDYGDVVCYTTVNESEISYVIPNGYNNVAFLTRFSDDSNVFMRAMIFEKTEEESGTEVVESGTEVVESGTQSGEISNPTPAGYELVFENYINLNEQVVDLRRIVWLPYDMDSDKEYKLILQAINYTNPNPIYFNGIMLMKTISPTLTARFSPNNGTDWLDLADHAETEFLLTETTDIGSGAEGTYGEWTAEDEYTISKTTTGTKDVYVKYMGDTEFTLLTKNFEYEESVDGNLIISFLRDSLDNAEQVKIEFYIIPTVGKLNIKIKQPSDTEGNDPYTEQYISDFGLYFNI